MIHFLYGANGMLNPKLLKWINYDINEGLLFFAQVLEESLFDHTLDSYKSPALNVHSCALELQYLANELYLGNIQEKSIEYSLQELELKIKNEFAISNKQKEILLKSTAKIKSNLNNHLKIIDVIDSILIYCKTSYWGDIKNAIAECVNFPKCKNEIKSLAYSFASELDQLQISRRYAYHKVKKFFFSPICAPKQIINPSVISGFFDLFEPGISSYTNIYKANENFYHYLKTFDNILVGIQKETPHIENAISSFTDFCNENSNYEYFIVFNEIYAKEPHKAKEISDDVLDFLSDLIKFHNHKANVEITDKCYIISHDDKHVLLNKSPNPMMRGILIRDAEKDEIAKLSLEICSGDYFDFDGRHSFHKALDFHNAAINSGAYENQLIDLWAALEGFFPQPDRNSSRISQFIDFMIPILTLTYPEKIFKNISYTIEKFHNDLAAYIKSLKISDNFYESCYKIVCCNDLQIERIDLYSRITKNPLLKNRIMILNNQFKNSTSIHKTLTTHSSKVTLHIKRIYTARNQIVHNAQPLPFIKHLVENLHSYFDTILLSLLRVVKKISPPVTISSCFETISIFNEVHLDYLKKQDKINCLTTTVSDYLFGIGNPLNE